MDGWGELRGHFVDSLQERFCERQPVPRTVQILDEASAGPRLDSLRCLDTLKDVHVRLTNFEARRSNEESVAETQRISYAKLFLQYGGDELLVRLIIFIMAYCDPAHLPREPEVYLRIKSVCLEILTKLISVEPGGGELSEKLTQDEVLMQYVFTLLTHKKTYMTACQFLEDMLQARRNVLNLNSVPDLRRIIMHGMDDEKLANFCRVLAVTISDLDIYENKSSLFYQNKQKRSKGFVNVRDINQEFLLSVPRLLERLVKIATTKDYSPRFMGVANELDSWMTWIDNSMADAAYDVPVTDDFDNFVGGISVMNMAGGPMIQQAGLKISMELIKRVQVVYVLGLFLVGKHRKKTQKALAELGIVPSLCEVFDQFIWKSIAHRNNPRHRLRGHNASCECSPEVALKIQFLRLIHSFCDHSDYKHLLLSKSELLEIRRINTKAGSLTVESLDEVHKGLMCKGSKGLLSKIIDVMKKEPNASTFRFWLARAVESYLRGSTSFCDQVFLLRRGLLEHITANIVEQNLRPKEILQSSFDLLGELIKFNVEAFRLFDHVFEDKTRFEKFVATVNRSLVDSNMFLRSLILSFEHFITVQTEHKQYALEKNPVLMHISKFDQQMAYLTKLINIINVQNLTQENVSCLNTSLVFLMFANQKAQLPSFLREMARAPVEGACKTSSSPLMKNFRDLLMFWQDHYLHKDKDCSALEKSSRVPFDYWKQTVSTLVSDDRNMTTAIIHYVDPEPCSSRDS